MTAYHDMKLGGFRVQVESLNIVQYVNVDASRFGYGGFRERLSPDRGIDVAANGYHWSNVREGFQYAWVAHVTGVNDQVRAAQSLQGFRAQQAVSVGDQSDFSRSFCGRAWRFSARFSGSEHTGKIVRNGGAKILGVRRPELER